jgi:hypothetical protein
MKTLSVIHRQRSTGKIIAERKPFGLGDAVAAVATPLARALRLPCIDPATKQLRPESGCARRKGKLNAALPDLRHPLGG